MANGDEGVVIRPASATTISDMIGILNVGREAFKSTYAGVVSAEDVKEVLKTKYSPTGVKHSLRNTNLRTWVAVKPQPSPSSWPSDDIVGFITARLDNPTSATIDPPYGNPVQLDRIYLSPAHQGGGIGRRLVETLQEWAREEGYQSVWLFVFPENEAAVGFYERLGYRRIREQAFTWGSGQRGKDLLMARTL